MNDDVAPRGGRRPASRAATSSVKSVLYSMGTENVQPGDPVSQGKRSVHSNSQVGWGVRGQRVYLQTNQ